MCVRLCVWGTVVAVMVYLKGGCVLVVLGNVCVCGSGNVLS